MGIQYSQQSAFVKEMQKWEHRPVMIGDTMIMPIPVEQGGKGGAPFQPYPKMLYKAHRADGGPRIDLQHDTHIVHNEAEERIALGRGWSDGQEAAIALVQAEDQEYARLAANRAYQERRMSPQAQAEAAAVDETSAAHLPSIPETKVKRRGRPVKTAPAVTE